MKTKRLDKDNYCIWCAAKTIKTRTITIDGEEVIVNLCSKCKGKSDEEIADLIGSLKNES